MSNHNQSSSLPSGFHHPTTTNITTKTSSDTTKNHSTAAPPPRISSNPNLTTCLYQTDLGLFSLTWSRNLFGHSLHLHLLLDHPSSTASDQDSHLSFPSLSTPSFHLHIKPYFFWNKHGSKKLSINQTTITKSNVKIFWDLSRAKFGSGPEPQSRFYIAVVIDGKMTLVVGDSPKEAYAKTKAKRPERNQVMVLRREHVYGNKLYTTKASFAGKERHISIDCKHGDNPRLCFYIDNKRVLQVKRLKWKFRGNDRIEVDNGAHINVSWDVYNWLFEDDEDGYASFMFTFEKLGFEDEDDQYLNNLNDKNVLNLWSQQSCGFEFETNKMKKGLLRTARSSSSSSLSSASSGCSSVMEWARVEENDLKGPSGFSLMVYAWKR